MAGREVKKGKKLLWIGDAVAHTGFARVTHSILDRLAKKWEVSVLGINHYGDPHGYNYNIYPASLGGDVYGINRLPNLIDVIQPDLVCAINDPWIVKEYVPILQAKNVPSVCYVPVDSPNMRREFSEALNAFDRTIGYTTFAIKELSKSGFTGKYSVIPHGTDLKDFFYIPQAIARNALNLPEDWFIVGSVARN